MVAGDGGRPEAARRDVIAPTGRLVGAILALREAPFRDLDRH